MKFYRDGIIERIGYDFYCDIAINIVKRREELELTQKELAEKAKIKLSRLGSIENVKYRIRLDEIESLADALDITVNNLINAKIDTQATDMAGVTRDCIYTVCIEGMEEDKMKIYSEATSKRMAFLKLEKRLNDKGLSFFSGARTRVIVELVGVPITDQELKDKLPKFKEDQEIEK